MKRHRTIVRQNLLRTITIRGYKRPGIFIPGLCVSAHGPADPACRLLLRHNPAYRWHTEYFISYCATSPNKKRSFEKDLVSGKRDSNPRPSAWEADALPTELLPRSECKYTKSAVFITKNRKFFISSTLPAILRSPNRQPTSDSLFLPAIASLIACRHSPFKCSCAAHNKTVGIVFSIPTVGYSLSSGYFVNLNAMLRSTARCAAVASSGTVANSSPKPSVVIRSALMPSCTKIDFTYSARFLEIS